MTLWELNAHFINTHRQVKCDMCNQYFNTPSSLKNTNTHIVMRNMCAGAVTMNSHLRVNCTLIATHIVEAEVTFVFMPDVTNLTISQVTSLHMQKHTIHHYCLANTVTTVPMTKGT